MSWFLWCSWCGGPFKGENCRCCTNVSFEDEFIRNPDPISYDETPDFSYPPPQPQIYSCELCESDSHYGYDCSPRVPLVYEHLLLHFNSICYDDDDCDKSTITLNEIISQIPLSIAITLVLPTVEPKDSLIMGDENLSTIPKKESDKVIKSSVEDLVPIPSDSEDKSDNDKYISSDINHLYNEVFEDIDHENSLLAIDDPFLLDTPPLGSKLVSLEEVDNFDPSLSLIRLGMMTRVVDIPSLELNEDECFDLGGGEIDADILPDFKDDYYNSKGDIIYLESLLINDTIPYLPPEVFLDRDPKSLNDEPNIDDLKIKENVRFTFEDRHYLSLTFVIQIFLPFLTYLVNSLLLLSSENEDNIFDPDIPAYSFYSLEPMAYECPMMIFKFFYFCLKDKGIQGESS
ncbi:hypothetical protein Tco_0821370 [Tanacetum coccineum]|uniref:Uncharacterized protein n=1 Tax=Tanacetum coccineum TaxID=301880 RepID=A0ABQ5AC15_9ASTR